VYVVLEIGWWIVRKNILTTENLSFNGDMEKYFLTKDNLFQMGGQRTLNWDLF